LRGVEERKDKFQVDQDWALPEVMRLVPYGGRLDQHVRKLDDTYFDTPGAGLGLLGITLRRRVGGSETGWQLTVPNGTARTELRSGSRSQTLPAALAKSVASLLAAESLVPIARLMTTRTSYWVLTGDGELVLDIADDRVEPGPSNGWSTQDSWREVEVGLGPAGKKKELQRAGKLLRAAGANPSSIRTKLDRALGSTSIVQETRSSLALSENWSAHT
jgi:inorganic triphosphatase YgiF